MNRAMLDTSEAVRQMAPDLEVVIYRLEEAGRTQLAMRGRVGPATYGSSMPSYVQDVVESYGWNTTSIRPPIPSAEAISRMDEAWRWLMLIPESKYVLRRIVGARSLIQPVTGRHLFSWRRLGRAMGADHRAVQRWHEQGVAWIVAGLRVKCS